MRNSSFRLLIPFDMFDELQLFTKLVNLAPFWNSRRPFEVVGAPHATKLKSPTDYNSTKFSYLEIISIL